MYAREFSLYGFLYLYSSEIFNTSDCILILTIFTMFMS